jgi:aryl-alcohol dehydrogenase-like predicted oxidoreductase
MEYRTLGASGLSVSTLCLGSMTFGEADESSFMHNVGCDEPTSHAILGKALDAGINFVDTADVYGQDGLSERVIGNWFASAKTRDRTVLATKCRFRMAEGPNGTGASRLRIVRAVEASLRRLNTDRIDLYQIHMQDLDTPEDETLRALDDLVRQGKVLYIGASNYAAYRLTDAMWISKTQNLERFIALQMRYNLIDRDLEREHVPLCREHGLGIIPWSPLSGGLLSGKYVKGETPPAGTRLDKWKERLAKYDTERNWNILGAVTSVAKELGSTPAAVSLAWLLRKPAVTSVIFGARSIAQLDDNVAAGELSLPDDAFAVLDKASEVPLTYPYDFMHHIQGRW